jgi:hypothetical protein
MAQLNAKSNPQLSEEIRESNVFQHHRHFSTGETMRRSYHLWNPALLVNSIVFWYEVRSDIAAGISWTSFFFSHEHGTISRIYNVVVEKKKSLHLA